MTPTDLTLTLDLDRVSVYAEELPNHEAQIDVYAAAGLTRPEAFGLEASAAKIITLGRRSVIEIGRELVRAREDAKYRTWGPFLARCGLEERTAQNYMNTFRSFHDKPEIISALPATTLYLMAAPNADPTIVDAIVEEVRSGTPPTPAAIKQRLAPTPAAAPPAAQQQSFAPPDNIPHLPADFKATQQRAEKVGLVIAMSADGMFSWSGGGRGATGYSWSGLLTHIENTEFLAAVRPSTLSAEPAIPAYEGAHEVEPPDDDTEEIAAAAPPAPPPAPLTLTPLPQALPPMLPGMAASSDLQARKLRVCKRALLTAALALLDAEPAQAVLPPIVIPGTAIEAAARSFLNNPALGGAASMLAFSARVEEDA